MRYEKVGIDIGSYSIKIATIEKVETNNSFIEKATKTYMLKHDKDLFKHIKECINDFTKINKITFADLYFSFPFNNDNTIVKNVFVPKTDDKTINKGLRFEVSSILEDRAIDDSLGINDYNYLWEISESKMIEGDYEDEDSFIGEKEIKVTTAILSKEITNALSKLKRVTWKISNIELQPFSVGRLLNKDNAAVIDFGHSATRVYLYNESNFYEANTIDIGGRDILKKTKEMYPHLSSDEIIKYMSKNTLLSNINNKLLNFEVKTNEEVKIGEDTIKFEEIIQFDDDYILDLETEYMLENEEPSRAEVEPLTKEDISEEEQEEKDKEILDMIHFIANEIKRIIRRFELETGISLENVYYVGGLSRFNYLPEFISAELSINLEGLELLNAGTKVNLDEKRIGGIKEYETLGLIDYTCASSSVLLDEYKYYEKLNFQKFAKTEIDYGSILVGAICLSVLINGAIYVVNNKYQKSIDAGNFTISNQEQTITSVNNDLSSIQNDIDIENAFINKINGIAEQKKWFSDILFKLSSIAPKGVVIDNIYEEQGVTTVTGYSRDYSNIGYFAVELEKLGEVKIDTIDNISEEDRDKFLYKSKENKPYKDKEALKNSFKITLNHKNPILEH